MHGLQRIDTRASRMQNSPAIFTGAQSQISEIAGPNPTSHNTCTGCRESHPTALVHAPCALILLTRPPRRPPGPHHKAPPRDLESSSHQLRSAQISSHQLTSDQSGSHQLRSDQITSDQLTSDHINSHQLTSEQVSSHQLRSAKISY